jgi:hypothetical protein
MTQLEKAFNPEAFKLYEGGKHRRYSLLFAVNGGAFAIAKMFADPNATTILGHLSRRELSLGMALFTIVMAIDIFMFGEKMRKEFLPGAFGWQGKVVLILIGALVCGGWLLVA